MKICRLCGSQVPAASEVCPKLSCPGMGPGDIVERNEQGFVEFTCPQCGGSVLYAGVVPAALECDTRDCPNYRWE